MLLAGSPGFPQKMSAHSVQPFGHLLYKVKGSGSVTLSDPSMQRWKCSIHNGTLKNFPDFLRFKSVLLYLFSAVEMYQVNFVVNP